MCSALSYKHTLNKYGSTTVFKVLIVTDWATSNLLKECFSIYVERVGAKPVALVSHPVLGCQAAAFNASGTGFYYLMTFNDWMYKVLHYDFHYTLL